MGIKVANNAFATLASGITSSATSITVASGQGARFPSLGAGDYFYATLINTSNQLEIVKCTARSADVLTVERAQESTTARSYDVGDRIEIRITAATFEDATAIYNVPSGTTGYFGMPVGTTAQRPVSPPTGASRFNTTTGSLEFFDGTTWISTNLIPTVNSVTGTIYAGAASTLTLSVTNATDVITVRFSEAGTVLADVTNVTVTSGSASVTVPSAVFNQTAGDVIAVSIINQDGTPSSNSINRTVQALPSGGTITTAGGFRTHTFTTSDNFVVPSGFNATAEALVVAGGGGGGCWVGGGGGAGGVVYQSPLSLTAGTYSAVVGAGGNGTVNNTTGGATVITGGTRGSNSLFPGVTTAIGGGLGASHTADNTAATMNGGSGGGNSGSAWAVQGQGTAGQGFAGGIGHGTNPWSTGGGGGASEVGRDRVSGEVSGRGGHGRYFAQFTNAGSPAGFFGGGGGGGKHDPGGSAGVGGDGGGGTGLVASTGKAGNGAANTGGGGGGNGNAGNLRSEGGNGGSGIVIIRYQI